MAKQVEYEFCMSQFKPAIVIMTILLVIVIGWTGWHCTNPGQQRFHLAFFNKQTPQQTAPASPISVKAPMPHPYMGNCNQCHVTIDAGKPISKVMAGPPISIKQKMLHKYWGNCLLCHQVVDGFQATPAQAQQNTPQQAKAAAYNQLTEQSLGLKLETVTANMMQQFGLAKKDGVLVLEVTPQSIANKAGMHVGDELIRMNNTRLNNINDFRTSLNQAKPGSILKFNLYRGTRPRNIYLQLPKSLTPSPVQPPMTQNQIETMAEQLGVPKTQ
ncbi:MAG: PDZ domain-containing protein, partial [Desulfobacterales bacterium]|nr:PDZ domain-containing protein [Desulfobacterales bacterium]